VLKFSIYFGFNLLAPE